MASLVLTGFKKLLELLTPTKFESRLKKEVKRATMKNALLAEGAIKVGITTGKMAANSDFTKMLKGSSRPLVDTGELLKSITGRALAWDYAVVGVLKSRAIKDKQTGQTRDLLSVAQILHSGATVNVTPAMRKFFFWMADRYAKGEIKQAWKPLRASTKMLVIPPRPFLELATTATMLAKYEANWAAAVQRALGGKG